MKYLILLVLPLLISPQSWAGYDKELIADKIESKLATQGFHTQDLVVSEPENPIKHLAEVLVFAMPGDFEVYEVHFWTPLNTIWIQMNCKVMVNEEKDMLLISRCNLKNNLRIDLGFED